VQALTSGAGSYLAAEAANSSPLQTIEQSLLGAIQTPPRGLVAIAGHRAVRSGRYQWATTILFGRQLISTWPSVSLGGSISTGKAR